VSDNQAAIARELTEMEALVIVDPIPPILTPVPRQAVLKLMLGAVLGLFVAGVVLALRGEFTAPPLPTQLGVSSAA